jgi:hypothetical protein
MNRWALWIVSGCLALLLAACSGAPSVVQGKVVEIDGSGKSITVEDERRPGEILVLDTAKAVWAAAPRRGETVRIAYNKSGKRLSAGRVMVLGRPEPTSGGGH